MAVIARVAIIARIISPVTADIGGTIAIASAMPPPAVALGEGLAGCGNQKGRQKQ
jgi:hypothetical protein